MISPTPKRSTLRCDQHANCAPSDSDYQPHAIVAYVKPQAVKRYVGNELLAGRRWEVSTLSIRPKDGEPELVQLIDAPAPWKAVDYNRPGDEIKPRPRKRAKSSLSRPSARKRPRGEERSVARLVAWEAAQNWLRGQARTAASLICYQ